MEALKVILEVLLQKFNDKKSDNSNDYLPQKSFKLSADLCDGVIVPEILENVVETIKKKAKEESTRGNNDVKKIVYEALLVIFFNTTQQERFFYLKELLDHFYNRLVQKLLRLKKEESIPTIEDFNEIISKLLPFVKLQVVKDASEKEKNGKLKVCLMELYETALYPVVNREDCYEIIKNKLGTIDSTVFEDFEIKPVDQKNGFLGEYFKLKICVTREKVSEVHHFFLKHVPTNSDEVRTNMARASFKKEEEFYTKFIPYLKKLGFAAILDFLPDCYLSRANRFMVFVDAGANDYSNLDITVPFTYEQLSLVYKQLGKLHACGILFEEKLSKVLKTKFRLDVYCEEMLKESFAIKNDALTSGLFDSSIRTNNYAIDKLLKRGSVEEFKKNCSDAFFKLFQIVEASENRRNFLTHGDLWCNNFFFNADQTVCLLLDFQIIRYNSPAFDVYFLLATNTDLKTRLKYGKKLLNEYYSNLKTYLSQYNVNINNILTHDQFLKNVQEVKPTCLVVALMYLLLMLLPKEKMVPIFENSELSQTFFTGDRTQIMNELWDHVKHKSRYEDIIQELYLVFNM